MDVLLSKGLYFLGDPVDRKKSIMFLKKSSCGPRHRSVNTPSPAAQRCTNGAPDGPHGNETQEKIEIDEAGRAEQVRAHSVDFVSNAL